MLPRPSPPPNSDRPAKFQRTAPLAAQAPEIAPNDPNRGKKASEWADEYLKEKTKTCQAQKRPKVYFGCCECEKRNVIGCEAKCAEPKDMAFQLFSDGNMKIQNCVTGTHEDHFAGWSRDHPGLQYMPGMVAPGVSKGVDALGTKGINAEYLATGDSWSFADRTLLTNMIAVWIGGPGPHDAGIVIGCSHGYDREDLAPLHPFLSRALRSHHRTRCSHATPSPRSQL